MCHRVGQKEHRAQGLFTASQRGGARGRPSMNTLRLGYSLGKHMSSRGGHASTHEVSGISTDMSCDSLSHTVSFGEGLTASHNVGRGEYPSAPSR